MKPDKDLNKRKLLNDSFDVSDNGHEFVEQRRGVVKSVLGVVASIPLISRLSSAHQTSEPEERDIQQKQVTRGMVQRRLEETSTELLDALANDDLISEPYATSVPAHQMKDPDTLGGIERVEINGEEENILVHKPTTNGGRLSLLLPMDGGDASAEYFPKEEEKIVEYFPSGHRQVRKQPRDVQTQATCNDYCTRCCTYCKPSGLKEQEPCPNCWIGNCKTVNTDCDGCDCSNYPSEDCVPP